MEGSSQLARFRPRREGASPAPGSPAWRSYAGKTGTQNIWLQRPAGLVYRSHRAVGSTDPPDRAHASSHPLPSPSRGNDLKGGLALLLILEDLVYSTRRQLVPHPRTQILAVAILGGSFLPQGHMLASTTSESSLPPTNDRGSPNQEQVNTSPKQSALLGHSPTHQQAGGLQ